MPSRLLAYIVVVSVALLTTARSRAQRRNVGTDTTAPREQGSSSTEYDDQLNFDGTLLSIMNMSDWNSNKMVKREAGPFKTVRLSPSQHLVNVWEGIISINKGERVPVVFATGTSNTWAHASKFSVEGLTPKSSFGVRHIGGVYEVPVTVAGVEVSMSIGHVTRVHGNIARYMSGILGLGLSGPYFDAPSFYELAIRQGLVKPVFAFVFEKDNVEFHFGGVDEDRFNKDKLEWHVLVPFQGSRAWKISKGNVDIAKDKGALQGIVTLFDTGTPKLLAPAAAVVEIQRGIRGSVWNPQARELLVPCGDLPQISLRWGAGEPWELNHDIFISKPLQEGHPVYKTRKVPMCIAAIIVNKVDGWVINPLFLKDAYTIFDWGEKRIGLGKVIKKS